MKKALHMALCAAGIYGGASIYAQAPTKQETAPAIVRARSQSVLERFDDQLVPDRRERRKMKQQRLAAIRHRRAIIDTLPISERQRKKLLRELYRSPHESLWDKTISHLEFEEATASSDPE